MNRIITNFLKGEGKGLISSFHDFNIYKASNTENIETPIKSLTKEEKKNVEEIYNYLPTNIGRIALLVNNKKEYMYVDILEELTSISEDNSEIVLDIGGGIYKFEIDCEIKKETAGGYNSEDRQEFISIKNILSIKILDEKQLWDNYTFKNNCNLETVRYFIVSDILNNTKFNKNG